MSDTPAPALKEMFNEARYRKMARDVAAVHPRFDQKRFLAHALPDLAPLSLLQRLRRATEALRVTLPEKYPAALEVLRRLLTSNGSIWISIVDNEMPYLRVLMDEVFGRANFIATVIWEKVYSPKSSAKFLSANHDYVVCYAKDSSQWQRNLLPRTAKQDNAYKNPDDDPYSAE